MEWILKRVAYQPTRTLGYLYVNGDFFCYTLEDKVRPDGVKVWGETAIPSGRYSIAITFSNRFKRPMIQVLNVPMFSGIRVHPGVSEKNTHGCILVSRNRQGNVLHLEREACTILEDLLKREGQNKKATLLIVDDPTQVPQRPIQLPVASDVPEGSPVLANSLPPTWAQIEPPSYSKPNEPVPQSPAAPVSRLISFVAEVRIALAAMLAYIGGIDRRHILLGILAVVAVVSMIYLLKLYKEKT